MPIWLKVAIWMRWDGGCSLSDIVHFSEIYFNNEETPESEFWEYSESAVEPEESEPENHIEMYYDESSDSDEED